jgi:TRAP-type mannitol/chloroaromatic compound transport system permease small subunit
MVNMEMVHQRFPFRFRSALDAVLLMLPMLIAGMMFWIGGNSFLTSLAKLEHTNTVWGPPLYPVKGVIPLAAFLLLLQVFAQFIRRVYAIITGQLLELDPDRSAAGPTAGGPQ